jgi:hypothetical protein
MRAVADVILPSHDADVLKAAIYPAVKRKGRA